MRKICFVLMFISFASYAQTPQVKTDFVFARGGESLKDLLENNIGIPKEELYQNGLFKKIKRWNRHISNSKSLARGERVYIELPYNLTLTPNTGKVLVTTKTIIVEKEIDRSKVWNLSGFYAISRGSYTDQLKNSNVATSASQDSPITLGVSAGHTISERWSYSGSFYISKFDNGETSATKEINIPWEFGLTSYAEYRPNKWSYLPYIGIDVERFPTFNTDEIAAGYTIATREHELLFLTAGLSKVVMIGQRGILLKASISNTIYSAVSRPSLVNGNTPFSGTKYIIFGATKISKNTAVTALFKQHFLTGVSTLTITRLGLGLSYSFF